MKTILLLSAKEVREGLRNRWVLAATGLLAALALTLVFLGVRLSNWSAPVRWMSW